ncbi:hypothetical protein MATL_G00176740 [Megalops atlanticus]|uniref:Uncharacterized protein n=1 Tax=Megalops atlanticus TaxID=7932 RepID=A0A9D3PLM2_MEGAT|nr:hypothetical protein MATL_G00176740 [Megalops atlanticus]
MARRSPPPLSRRRFSCKCLSPRAAEPPGQDAPRAEALGPKKGRSRVSAPRSPPRRERRDGGGERELPNLSLTRALLRCPCKRRARNGACFPPAFPPACPLFWALTERRGLGKR